MKKLTELVVAARKSKAAEDNRQAEKEAQSHAEKVSEWREDFMSRLEESKLDDYGLPISSDRIEIDDQQRLWIGWEGLDGRGRKYALKIFYKAFYSRRSLSVHVNYMALNAKRYLQITDNTEPLLKTIVTALMEAEEIANTEQEAADIHRKRTQHLLPLASDIISSAKQIDSDYENYRDECQAWATAWMEKIWEPWEAHEVHVPTQIKPIDTAGNTRFAVSRGTVSPMSSLPDHIASDSNTNKVITFNDPAHLAKNIMVNGWTYIEQLLSNGTRQQIVVTGIMSSNPIKFEKESIDVAMPYHISVRAGHFYLNIPPYTDIELPEPPMTMSEPWTAFKAIWTDTMKASVHADLVWIVTRSDFIVDHYVSEIADMQPRELAEHLAREFP